jgi:MprA protease rhombosortase-interaction domain-containing protein
VAGPSNSVSYTKPVDSGSGFIDVAAGAYGDTGDLVFATLSLNGFSYGTYGGQGSFTLNFSTAVTFTSGGETILDGHVFDAGIRTIDWAFGGNLASVTDITGVAILFRSSGSSVPPPGAAVLAAAGLAGLGRRRRR